MSVNKLLNEYVANPTKSNFDKVKYCRLTLTLIWFEYQNLTKYFSHIECEKIYKCATIGLSSKEVLLLPDGVSLLDWYAKYVPREQYWEQVIKERSLRKVEVIHKGRSTTKIFPLKRSQKLLGVG